MLAADGQRFRGAQVRGCSLRGLQRGKQGASPRVEPLHVADSSDKRTPASHTRQPFPLPLPGLRVDRGRHRPGHAHRAAGPRLPPAPAAGGRPQPRANRRPRRGHGGAQRPGRAPVKALPHGDGAGARARGALLLLLYVWQAGLACVGCGCARALMTPPEFTPTYTDTPPPITPPHTHPHPKRR